MKINPASVQLAALLWLAAGVAQAQTEPFIGEWRNPRPQGGLTRLIISGEKSSWHIQAWGQCHPKDCDWGRVSLKVLGGSISDTSAKYGFAHWDHSFADVYMTLELDKGTLIAETYDFFKDGSGRADYHSASALTRVSADAPVPTNAASLRDAGEPPNTFLEVISAHPESPATLKAGERATVKIRYNRTGDGTIRIWAQPYSQGSYTPDGFFSPSRLEPAGPGELERSVGVNSPAVADEIRISMVDAESREKLTEISYPVDITWEGTVPKPETIAPVGQPFPDLKFTSIQDQDIDVAALKGKVVLVDFWATWCGPCRKEIPGLVEAYKEYYDDGFEILGISLDKDRETLEKYVRENDMTWPQYFDGKGWKNEISKRFAVRGIPCSYLIDREGVVRHIDLRGERLTEAIERLLKR